MRVCILTLSFPRTADDDAGIFIKRLVKAYSLNGISGVVIVPHDTNEPSTEQCGTFTIYRFRYGIFKRGALAFGAGIMPNLRARPMLILQAPALITILAITAWRQRHHYDFFHANWLPTAFAAWLIRLFTGKAYLVTLRGEDARLLTLRGATLFFSSFLGGAAKVTAVSEHIIATLKRKFPTQSAKISYVPNGVSIDIPSIEAQEEFKRERLFHSKEYLLTVGTVIPRKRVEVLIELMTEPPLQKYNLLICGRLDDTDYCSKLQNISKGLGLTNRVHFLGAAPPQHIPFYLSLSSAFVSASSYEGKPNAVLEALAAGALVCVSDIEAHQELIKDGENGLLFKPTELAAFADRLSGLLSHRELTSKLKENAQQSVSQFNWTETALRYAHLFQEMGGR